MRLRLRSLLLLSPLLLLPSDLHAQGIRGQVLDAATEQPIASATVVLLDGRERVIRGVVSDSTGAFSIRVGSAGRYHLRTERIGYHTVISPPIDLSGGDTLQVELRMATQAVVMAPLTVTASSRRSLRDRTLDDFYRRQMQGWGTFYGPREIERLQPMSISSLLQGTPGVNIHYPRGTGTQIMMRTTRGDCRPTVFVNGSRFAGDEIDSWISASSLRAVEVYTRNAEAPVEFASVLNWDCGVIAIWTSMRVGP